MSDSSLPIGLGTAAIGRPSYINIRQEKEEIFPLDAFRQKGKHLLELAYNLGVCYFDTAPGYGLAEDLLIEWLKEKNNSNIEVATKWGYTYVAEFDPNASVHEVKEHSLDKLNEQWQQSINLLPFLTTYQIHSATLETGVLENKAIINRLAELKHDHDLIIGLSATGANQLEVLKRALDVEVEGIALFDAFQVTYNMLDQSIADILNDPMLQQKRIIVKEALANGRIFYNENFPHYSDLYKTLNSLANKYEVGVDAIALRFCVDSINPYKVLSGAAIDQHIIDNLKSTSFKLQEEEIDALKKHKISPPQYWKERSKLNWN